MCFQLLAEECLLQDGHARGRRRRRLCGAAVRGQVLAAPGEPFLPARRPQPPRCQRSAPSLLCTAAVPVPAPPRRCVPMNQVRGIFGFSTDDNIGKIAFPAIQVWYQGGVSACMCRLLPRYHSTPRCALHETKNMDVSCPVALAPPPLCFLPAPPAAAGRPRLPRLVPPHVWGAQGRAVSPEPPFPAGPEAGRWMGRLLRMRAASAWPPASQADGAGAAGGCRLPLRLPPCLALAPRSASRQPPPARPSLRLHGPSYLPPCVPPAAAAAALCWSWPAAVSALPSLQTPHPHLPAPP